MSILSALLTIDAALASHGVYPMSPYWKREVTRFYERGAGLLVECVGRGGDKSRTAVKMAIAEVLAGDFVIPPGERHYFAHASISVREALKTLAILEKYLGLLDVPYKRTDETIELDELPRGFKVTANTVDANSGFRCIGWTADECWKWPDSAGADPVEDVVASIRAMTVTHRTARGRMFSSPLAEEGYVFDLWSQGTTDTVVTGAAATWVANESVDEAHTHVLEAHEPTWRREYAALPSGTRATAAFDRDAVDAAFAYAGERLTRVCAPIVAMDPSSLARDSFAYLSAGWVSSEPTLDQKYEVIAEFTDAARGLYAIKKDGAGRDVLRKDFVEPPRRLIFGDYSIIPASYANRVTATDVYRGVAELAHGIGASMVATDPHDHFSGNDLLKQFGGMGSTKYNWSSAEKQMAVARFRRYLYANQLIFAGGEHAEQMRSELRTFEEKVTAKGITYEQKRDASGGHRDLASCALLCMLLDADGSLDGAPANGAVRRGSVVVDSTNLNARFG